MSQICEIDLHQTFQTFYDLKNLFNRRFSSNYLLIVIDVFKHHRFCDEFSHLLNGCFPSSVMLYWCLKSFKLIFIELFKLFMTSKNLFNRRFSSNYLLIVIDVFKHHRFCDEFSHLLNGCFPSSVMLYWCLKSFKLIFIELFKLFMTSRTNSIDVFYQVTCSL